MQGLSTNTCKEARLQATPHERSTTIGSTGKDRYCKSHFDA